MLRRAFTIMSLVSLLVGVVAPSALAFVRPPPPSAPADSDHDGLTNIEEAALGTNPNSADTDGDGLGDFAEVRVHGTDPRSADSDGDGLSDFDELMTYLTHPWVADEWVGSQNSWAVIYSPDGTLTTSFDSVLSKSSPKNHGQAVSAVAKAAPKEYRAEAASAVARTDWGR